MFARSDVWSQLDQLIDQAWGKTTRPDMPLFGYRRDGTFVVRPWSALRLPGLTVKGEFSLAGEKKAPEQVAAPPLAA
jgi:hypothetical protein